MFVIFPVLLSGLPKAVTEECPKSIPWDKLEKHRAQAERNHYQTLERLAQRGGLSPEELWAAVNNKRPWEIDIFSTEAVRWLNSWLAR